MKKTGFKSVLSFLLAFIIAFSCFSVFALAAEMTIVKQPDNRKLYQGVDWIIDKKGKVTVLHDIDLHGTVLSYNGKEYPYVHSVLPNLYALPLSDKWTPGINKIKIKCDDLKGGYAITTIDLVQPVSITIVSPPAKTVLYEGEDWKLGVLNDVECTEFDCTGLVIEAVYSDGKKMQFSADKSAQVSWSFDPEIDIFYPGKNTMYATFCGLMAPFEVNFLKEKPKYTLGDVNSDGKISSYDALLTLKDATDLAKLDAAERLAADVDKNNKINSTDALMILQYSVGILTSF